MQRAFKLAGSVAIFSEAIAIALIEALKPDIYVKAGSWKIETLPEASAVRA